MTTVRVFACDPPTTHLFTGNAHDALLIGEIISVDEVSITVTSIEFIVSAYNACGGFYREQIQPDTVRVIKNEEMHYFDVGHYVLASLNQEDDVFIVANGIYEIELVELQDFTVWHVQAEDELISALYSDFVNQQGRYRYNVWNLRDGYIIRYQEDSRIIIFDSNSILPQDIQPRDIREVGEESTTMPTYGIYFCTGLIWIMVLNTFRLFVREIRNRRTEEREWRVPNMLPNDFTLRETIKDMCNPLLVMLIAAGGLTFLLWIIDWISAWYFYLIVASLAVIFIISWFMATDRITWNVKVEGNSMKLNFFNLDFKALRKSISVDDIRVEKRSNGNIVLFTKEGRLFTVWKQNAAYGLMLAFLFPDEIDTLDVVNQQCMEKKCTACGAPIYGKRCEYCGARVRKSH